MVDVRIIIIFLIYGSLIALKLVRRGEVREKFVRGANYNGPQLQKHDPIHATRTSDFSKRAGTGSMLPCRVANWARAFRVAFGTSSGLDPKKLSGFHRAGRRSKMRFLVSDSVFVKYSSFIYLFISVIYLQVQKIYGYFAVRTG